MSYIISKDLEFSYGHRVWSQRLDGEFSSNLLCACRHLHGHEAKVTVSLTAPTLTDGMVTDFRHLEWLKTFINVFIDHQFILDRHDPLYNRLVGNFALSPITAPGCNSVAGYLLCRESIKDLPPAEREMMEGFFIVDFVPTSENLSAWLAKLVQEKMAKLGVTVQSVTWWETPKSRSEYVV